MNRRRSLAPFCSLTGGFKTTLGRSQLVWNSKHDLAELPALFKIRLRGSGLFERENNIDDGFNPRTIQETQELAKFFPASEGRAVDL